MKWLKIVGKVLEAVVNLGKELGWWKREYDTPR